jgi:hypothetical protein
VSDAEPMLSLNIELTLSNGFGQEAKAFLDFLRRTAKKHPSPSMSQVSVRWNSRFRFPRMTRRS